MSTVSPALSTDSLRSYLRQALEAKLEPILATARPSGQFGTEPWIVRDQDVMLTLALLLTDAGGPHFGSPRLQEALAAGGRYLRSRQDARGMFPFDKKDGSHWGPIFMPWTYLRWMITYHLCAEQLSAADRSLWAEGLQLGYAGIAATELSSRSNIYPGPLPGQPSPDPDEVVPWVHNIPCHHATGLFLAGRVFQRPDWVEQARAFMDLVLAAQSPHGWWTEHAGPVVLYNRVYLEALGLYHALSGESAVLPALERGAAFHLHYTYPNGAAIETVDERNPYTLLRVVTEPDGRTRHEPEQVNLHVGLLFSAAGRALLAHQYPLVAARDPASFDGAEFMWLGLTAAPAELVPGGPAGPRFAMGDRALVARHGPWVASFSAYTCPRTPNRFIQDRQNLLSLYHAEAGLILGGGNTKRQPRWSTLTVGSPNLVSPVGLTREADLAPDLGVDYTPEEARIEELGDTRWALHVTCAGASLVVTIELVNEHHARLEYRLGSAAPDGRPVQAHLTFIPYLGSVLRASDGTADTLTVTPWVKTGLTWLQHHRWRLALPATAEVRWPVLPHNPYTDNGASQPQEGRLVVSLPLKPDTPMELALTALPYSGQFPRKGSMRNGA
jgi:hypothetical protein